RMENAGALLPKSITSAIDARQTHEYHLQSLKKKMVFFKQTGFGQDIYPDYSKYSIALGYPREFCVNVISLQTKNMLKQ
ncbi:MAG: hypothetical protein RR336_09105, partial [Oscillospiraceae bacterium]